MHYSKKHYVTLCKAIRKAIRKAAYGARFDAHDGSHERFSDYDMVVVSPYFTECRHPSVPSVPSVPVIVHDVSRKELSTQSSFPCAEEFYEVPDVVAIRHDLDLVDIHGSKQFL